MYLTGYHGTSNEYAENILANQRFLPSTGEKEWLGHGIYFYPNFEDALNWAKEHYPNNEAVIHVLIHVNDNEIIDLNTIKGKNLFHNTVNIIGRWSKLSETQIQKNQCIVCNTIWEVYKNVKVLKSYFGKEKTQFLTLIDSREQRLEFCVRDNSIIRGIFIVPLQERNEHLNKIKKKEMQI